MPTVTLPRVISTVVCAATLAACSAPSTAPHFPPLATPPKNLVVVVIDTLRRDHVGAYGYRRPTTPTIDRLAAEGVRADGLAPSSWTKASTASLLTGLHPIHHQAVGRGDALPAQATTLAEILKTRGYRTFGFSTNAWISNAWGFGQGFDTLLLSTDLGYGKTGTTPDQVNREVLDRVLPSTKPYFLYVHYMDPHLPYDPATDWTGAPLEGDLERRGPITNDELDALNFRPRSPALVQAAIDLYDGEIRVADHGVERLLAGLEARGMLDDTLVVVTADHGEEFEEHGRMSHGQTLYREVTEVPLVFHAPKSFPGGKHLGTVSLMDVVPTVLDLMNLGVDARTSSAIDGVSVAEAVARSGSLQARDQLLHLDVDDGHAMALIHGTSKLVLSRYPFRKELFALDRDAGERENTFATDAPRVRTLGEALALSHNGLSAIALPRASGSAPSEIIDNLRALGYVSGADGEVEDRRIPGRVQSVDFSQDGPIGWEETARPCLSTVDLGSDSQLLAGWHRLAGERDGRWTEPQASLLVGPASTTGVADLTVTGINHRPGPFRLRLAVPQHVLYDAMVPRGPFTIRVPAGAINNPTLLRIDAMPPFRPSDAGAQDHRMLGTYLTRVCLTPGK